jgi:DNA-binding NarL/FixJ family response regulator
MRDSPDALTPLCRHDDGVARTLLIVDDHAGFRSFARALLESEGYAVVAEAADGASAVATARRLRPAIVLLDIALPDIDGFAVCEEITEGDGERPVVVLTSSRDASSYRDQLARSRARGFIRSTPSLGRRSPS